MHAEFSQQFSSVLSKRLSSVECVRAGTSRQQEIHAAVGGAPALGYVPDKVPFDTQFFYLDDHPDQWIEHRGTFTYADARRHQPSRRPEWRLTYRKDNSVMGTARPGDTLWLARRRDEASRLLVVVAARGTQMEAQLVRLLGAPRQATQASEDTFGEVRREDRGPVRSVDDAELLEYIGVEVKVEQEPLARLIEHLSASSVELRPDGWPTTKDFSAACRHVCGGVDTSLDADEQLVRWFEGTNSLFFGFEREIVQGRLDREFARRDTIDVDRFLDVAKSVLNSRKSRAGATFEHHLAALFDSRGVRYENFTRRALADGSRPDFIFPDRSVSKALELLPGAEVLAAKTTLKERWRQVRGEGALGVRYVASMDADLTPSLVAAMLSQEVVPVVARQYLPEALSAAGGVMSVEEFIERVARPAVIG